MPLENPINQKNLSPSVFISQSSCAIHCPFGQGNWSNTQPHHCCPEVKVHQEHCRSCSHALLCAGSRCKVISLSLMLSHCKLNCCCLTFTGVNTTQTWLSWYGVTWLYKSSLSKNIEGNIIAFMWLHARSQSILSLHTDDGFCSTHLPVTLLHYGYLLYNLLQVRLHRNLFDCNHLTRLFMNSFEHTAIGTGNKILNK